MTALSIALPFVVALFAAAFSTPIVARAALRFGIVDRPSERKVNLRQNMPLMGGIAIAIGTLAGLTVVVIQFGPDLMPLDRTRGFLLGGLVVLVLGITDDRFGMRALAKLMGQITAAVIAFANGFAIQSFRFPISGDSFELYWWVSFVVTVFWIVAVTNAINLIDGLDGLASGLSAIVALTLSYICYTAGQPAGVVFGAALIGATLGFLPFNFPPARIFLGDTGALFLGFCLSLIAIEGYTGGYRRASVLAFAVPFLALAVPLMDTSLSILRRVRSGRGIFDADRLHMHHRLLSSEGSQSRAVIFLYLLTACFCAIAVSFMDLQDLAVAGALLVAVAILTFRLLRNLGAFSEGEDITRAGHHEPDER